MWMWDDRKIITFKLLGFADASCGNGSLFFLGWSPSLLSLFSQLHLHTASLLRLSYSSNHLRLLFSSTNCSPSFATLPNLVHPLVALASAACASSSSHHRVEKIHQPDTPATVLRGTFSTIPPITDRPHRPNINNHSSLTSNSSASPCVLHIHVRLICFSTHIVRHHARSRY